MSSSFHLTSLENALVVGGGHGIGFEAVKYILKKSKAQVYVLYSNASRGRPLLDLSQSEHKRVLCYQVDWRDEQKLEDVFSRFSQEKIKFDLILNTVGVLHSRTLGPEKSLRDIGLASLTESFQVNAFLTPLIAKYARSCLDRKKTFLMSTLSAMVGSIEDNSSGGWYSYRASKTALNMFIKNISLEFKRSFPSSVVLAVHPGTTHTELSKPFSKNVKHQVWSAEQTAAHLFDVFEFKSVEHTGNFYNWDGRLIPW